MEVSHLVSIIELKAFFMQYPLPEIFLKIGTDKYLWIRQQLRCFKYLSLCKKDKSIVIKFISLSTKYTKEYCLLVISKIRKGILEHKKYIRGQSHKIYSDKDVALLSETDILHKRLNAESTKKILLKEAEIHEKYKNIANVSASHINNLRKRHAYKGLYLNGTKANVVMIGTTCKPENNGMPGSIRVDTVHQRDVYYVNFVDEITQWQIVICVEAISERFLEPLLEKVLGLFPFTVFNFHSDRGCEFINKTVAKILNRLLIKQTKSRSRHCNDNALVETKNTIIRKEMGYLHIEKTMSDEINEYLLNYYTEYLNYYRPCRFQTGEIEDKKGRKYVVYKETRTPFEKLVELEYRLSLQCFGQTNLKLGIDLHDLYCKIEKISPNDYAKIMRRKKNELVTNMNQSNLSRTLSEKDFTDII
jgi:hypothetical protein